MAGGTLDDDFEAKVEAYLAKTGEHEKGFAIKENGKILVRTIQDRPVGAMINWLVTNGIVLRTTADQPWIDAFNERRPEGVDVVEVEVREVS